MLLYSLFKLIVIDFNEYIKKKLHSEKKSYIYTEAYIFDTYIFGTDYTTLWSVNPLSFLFI